MFKAYFDRSELGKPAPVMAVSGYLGAEEEWQQFEPAWRQVLDTFGVDVFHMREFECRLGGFQSWTNETRKAFLEQLIRLVSRHTIVGVGAAIVMKDYDSLSSDDQKHLGHPYAMCGLKAVADTLQWIDDEIVRQVATGRWVLTEAGKNLPVPVEFVFEAGDNGAGELGEQRRKEQGAGKFAGRILRWSFEDKSVGALQAADFAAYETTKQLVRTIGADERAMRKSLEIFVSSSPYVAEYFDGRTLGELLEIVRRDATA